MKSWLAASGVVLLGVVMAWSGCGFGTADDSGSAGAAANNGVAGAGPWWPWVCPNGSAPAAASSPQSYVASGSCGVDGGTFALSVNGCEMQGNWDALGLAGVATNVSTSIPGAGGWEVAATAGNGDGGVPVTCDATAVPSGVLIVACTVGDAGAPACAVTLTPVPAS